jgi:hypothetical protein
MGRDLRADSRQVERPFVALKSSSTSERSELAAYRPADGLRLPRTIGREQVFLRNRSNGLSGEDARVREGLSDCLDGASEGPSSHVAGFGSCGGCPAQGPQTTPEVGTRSERHSEERSRRYATP